MPPHQQLERGFIALVDELVFLRTCRTSAANEAGVIPGPSR
jgi:hypothetical protein